MITADSLQRALDRGMDAPRLNEWFERRAGTPMPAAIGLLLAARSPRPPRLKAARILVLTAPTAEMLEGMRQLPATAPFLGETLGPTSVAISDEQVAPLQAALKEIGLKLELD